MIVHLRFDVKVVCWGCRRKEKKEFMVSCVAYDNKVTDKNRNFSSIKSVDQRTSRVNVSCWGMLTGFPKNSLFMALYHINYHKINTFSFLQNNKVIRTLFDIIRYIQSNVVLLGRQNKCRSIAENKRKSVNECIFKLSSPRIMRNANSTFNGAFMRIFHIGLK